MASTSKLTEIHNHIHTSESSDSEEREIKRKRFKNIKRRVTIRPQQYRNEWENTFKGWLKPVKGNPLRARCDACKAEFQADLTVIKNHSKGSKHAKNIKILMPSQLKIDKSFSKRNEAQEQEVRSAEMKIAAFISEHNLPMSACDHLIPLLKQILPDSTIAKNLNMANMKCTSVVKNASSASLTN